MKEYIVKIVEANFITHDVKRFVVEKPEGYSFIPGQATDVCINLPEWKDKMRPFTFTGLNNWDHLEFMIKIYKDTHEVTDMLGHLNAGAELIIHEPFGAILYKGSGTFIAGGAGITPFIAILRELYKERKLKGIRLINSNKTSYDVIIGDELLKMLKTDFVNIYTREGSVGFMGKRIDRDFLIEYIADFSQNFYLCGPDEFVNDITKLLIELGATPEALVIEK